MKVIKYILPSLMLILLFAFSNPKVPSSSRSENAIQTNLLRIKKEFTNKKLTLGNPIFIRIFKESNELELWIKKDQEYQKFKTYKICYYSGDLGPKLKQGDSQSPEGFYFVKPNQLNPWSNFHLSFNIGYPNKFDRTNGRTGNYIMVHGSCVSIGCYAMTDQSIEELWTIITKAFEGGQPFFRVHIFPFKMTNESLESEKENENYVFWKNLQTGYSLFEKNRIPPNVEVENKKYVFN